MDKRLQAAHLLINRGIRFTIPDAPFWLRIRGKNKIHIRPLKAGTIILIFIEIQDAELENEDNIAVISSKLDALAHIIATAVINDKQQLAQGKADKLAEWLLWQVPAHVLMQIYNYIASLNQLKDFMNITKYFEFQTQMMMNPKNLGQTKKGS